MRLMSARLWAVVLCTIVFLTTAIQSRNDDDGDASVSEVDTSSPASVTGLESKKARMMRKELNHLNKKYGTHVKLLKFTQDEIQLEDLEGNPPAVQAAFLKVLQKYEEETPEAQAMRGPPGPQGAHGKSGAPGKPWWENKQNSHSSMEQQAADVQEHQDPDSPPASAQDSGVDRGAGGVHRRRGVSDGPVSTSTFADDIITTSTTTSHNYPKGYVGPGPGTVKKDWKQRWSADTPPHPHGKDRWGDRNWHDHTEGADPVDGCSGRRRHSRRRFECRANHRRRRHHRRRRRVHRRRGANYRRRRRRVHRRRGKVPLKDRQHRRREKAEAGKRKGRGSIKTAESNEQKEEESTASQEKMADHIGFYQAAPTSSTPSDSLMQQGTFEVNSNADLVAQHKAQMMRRHAM